jgi:hypothetical protein
MDGCCSDREHPKGRYTPPDDRVWCRRVEGLLPTQEHERCPYCYGRLSEIKTGRYSRFCDYKPGKDPINFGFPEDSSRAQHG